MAESLWIVGQALGMDPQGRVAWRKLGTFLAKGDADAYVRITGAGLLIGVEPGTVLPAFGEVAVGTVLTAREGA